MCGAQQPFYIRCSGLQTTRRPAAVIRHWAFAGLGTLSEGGAPCLLASLAIRIVQASYVPVQYLCRKAIMTQCRNHGCHASFLAANTCSCLEFPALNAWSQDRIANLHHCPAARHGVVGYRWTAARQSPALLCSRTSPSASRACSLCKPSDETEAARPPDTTPTPSPGNSP